MISSTWKFSVYSKKLTCWPAFEWTQHFLLTVALFFGLPSSCTVIDAFRALLAWDTLQSCLGAEARILQQVQVDTIEII